MCPFLEEKSCADYADYRKTVVYTGIAALDTVSNRNWLEMIWIEFELHLNNQACFRLYEIHLWEKILGTWLQRCWVVVGFEMYTAQVML